MSLAEVYTLYESNCRSIPAMLRTAADSVEGEAEQDDCSPTVAIIAVQVAENGQLRTYGWGDTDDLRCLGILARAQHELMADIQEAVES